MSILNMCFGEHILRINPRAILKLHMGIFKNKFSLLHASMFTLKMRKCFAGDNEHVTVGGGWDGELGEGTP